MCARARARRRGGKKNKIRKRIICLGGLSGWLYPSEGGLGFVVIIIFCLYLLLLLLFNIFFYIYIYLFIFFTHGG